jgi:hypothetical protein
MGSSPIQDLLGEVAKRSNASDLRSPPSGTRVQIPPSPFVVCVAQLAERFTCKRAMNRSEIRFLAQTIHFVPLV